MPGNICAHTHFYGAFARGMAIPGDPPRDFPEILGRLWWPLDKALRDMDVKYSALVSLADAIRHGTTTLIDHHASPNAIHDSLDQIADAGQLAGVRVCTCYEVSDRDGPERAQEGIDENVRFIETVGQRKSPLLAATFGLHASLTLSDETLADCVAAAPEGTGFHIHAAEGIADQEDSLRKSGKRVIERLTVLDRRHRFEQLSTHVAVHGDVGRMADDLDDGHAADHQQGHGTEESRQRELAGHPAQGPDVRADEAPD